MNNEEMDAKIRAMIECGREMATTWLDTAIRQAGSGEQARDQVNILEYASVHVVATSAMNFEGNQDELLERFFEMIRAEFAYMKTELVEGRLERVEHSRPASLPDAGLH